MLRMVSSTKGSSLAGGFFGARESPMPGFLECLGLIEDRAETAAPLFHPVHGAAQDVGQLLRRPMRKPTDEMSEIHAVSVTFDWVTVLSSFHCVTRRAFLESIAQKRLGCFGQIAE